MATTGGHLESMHTAPQRATRVLLVVIALTVGLMIGGFVGRLSAPRGSTATRSTHVASVTSSGLTPAEQRSVARQVQAVSSREMQGWEHACSPWHHSSANVC